MAHLPYRSSSSGGDGVRLDRLDFKILSTLQADGRITNLKLADQVGLSATPCLQRVRRLEAAGYIRAYGAEIDVQRLFNPIVVHSQVVLASQREVDAVRFERFVQGERRIVECTRVAGESDYLIKTVARDVADYQDLIDLVLGDAVGASRVTSQIATHCVKQNRGYPLEMWGGTMFSTVRQ